MTEKEDKSLDATMTLHFVLGDDGVLRIVGYGKGLQTELKLSGTDYDALFKQLGPEIGRALLARVDTLSFEAELRVRWPKKE
jgi:hypothetical protein